MKDLRWAILSLVFVLSGTGIGGQKQVLPTDPHAVSKIIGVVLDPNDALIVSATIEAENSHSKYEATSDQAGRFEINLPAGTYKISVNAQGFRHFELPQFKVNAGVSELVNIHMDVWRSGPEPVPQFTPLKTTPINPSDKLMPPKPTDSGSVIE